MIYWKYLKSLMAHKLYVLMAGLKTGVPVWRLVVHDWTKFLPIEFGPYARYFFAEGDKQPFDYAWLHHQKHNPHHWQYWILVYDEEIPQTVSLPMPETYVREMIADWTGASKAYTGSWDIAEWVNENGPQMILHDDTIERVWKVMLELGYMPGDKLDFAWQSLPILSEKEA